MCQQVEQIDSSMVFGELSKIPGIKKYRTSMADVIKTGDAMFRSIIPRLQSLVISASDADGNLQMSQRPRVVAAASDLVMSLFALPDGRVFAEDGVTALTPFAQMLNEFYVRVVMEAIYTQRNWMQKNMPTDLFDWLAGQNFDINLSEAENPFLRHDGESDEAFRARMADLRVFHPNPLQELDINRRWVPMHRWNDPNGYQLSERIWRIQDSRLAGVGPNTASRIDQMINTAFAENWGSLRLSRELERFLLPSRANLRTNRPYGTNASFDAMRLARTEIARAANHAAAVSAYLNPYVDKLEVARSPNGDRTCKICPQHATIGINGSRLRPAYSVHAAVYPVFHPHCVTPGQKITTMRGEIPIEEVVAGDCVLTHKGRFRRVKDAWSRPYEGLVHRINTGQSSVELTSEHPVLTSKGWLDAQFIEPEQNILHASINVFHDLNVTIPESKPAETSQFLVTPSIFDRIMPIGPIALNSNLAGNESEIQLVSPDIIFSLIDYLRPIQSLHHWTLNRIWDTLAFHFKQLLTTHNYSGIVELFGLRNFLPSFMAFSRIFITGYIHALINLGEYLASQCRASSIILFPLQFNSTASTTHLQIQMFHNSPETSEGDTKLLSTLMGTELLDVVEFMDNISDGNLKFSFNALDVFKCGMLFETIRAKRTTRSSSTLGASIWHNNLLSLSPDIWVGTESGNSVVEQVANPFQARLNYNTVSSVNTRQYRGLVYNMSVEEDESYVVDGMVVHNCKCHVRGNVTDTPAVVTNRLRAVYEDARANTFPPAVSPAAVDNFTNMLLHRALGSLVGQWRGQLPLMGF